MNGSNEYIDNVLKERQAELERIKASIETMDNDMEILEHGRVKEKRESV